MFLPLAEGMAPVLMFLAGSALLTAILLRRSYRYFGSRRARGGSGPAIDEQPRPQGGWDGAHRDVSAQIERQKVELSEIARDANGQLTSKIAMLEQLIDTSSKQIARMEELLEETTTARRD